MFEQEECDIFAPQSLQVFVSNVYGLWHILHNAASSFVEDWTFVAGQVKTKHSSLCSWCGRCEYNLQESEENRQD